MNNKNKKKTIVIIGDSFVQGVGDEKKGGWVESFSEHFKDKYTIFAKGYGGNNIYDVIDRLENDLFPFRPSIIILQVGINDSRLRKSLNFSNEIEKGAFIKGLESFITKITRKLGNKIVFSFIGTTPVVDDLTTPYKDDKYYSSKESEKYNEIIHGFCNDTNIIFINVFYKFKKTSNLKELLADGVHPNSKGHEIIANTVLNMFEKI